MIVIQYDDGKIPAYRTCTRLVRNSLPADAGYMLVDRTHITANCGDYRAVSNILRCCYARRFPAMLWLDSDVLIDRWLNFPFLPGKVYFAEGPRGDPENWAFFVNDRTDFFDDMYETFERNKPKDIWWFAKYVQGHREEVELIPKGYFTHLLMSRAILAGKNYMDTSTPRYSVKRNPLNEELSIEVR